MNLRHGVIWWREKYKEDFMQKTSKDKMSSMVRFSNLEIFKLSVKICQRLHTLISTLWSFVKFEQDLYVPWMMYGN